jgi:hypothetical protein
MKGLGSTGMHWSILRLSKRVRVCGLVWLLALIVFSQRSTAAEMSIAQAETQGAPAIVTLYGEFVTEDIERFRSLTAFISRAVILLQSDGGALIAGIQIGKIIRLKGYATFIPDNTMCSSACAIAWLGGVKRIAGRHAHIGFHAAAKGLGGPETGMGNALLGAYLSQIGLPEIAIAYITVASPQDMTWLNFEDAKKLGIDVMPFDPPPSSTPPDEVTVPAARPTPRAAQPQPKNNFEMKTRQFVADLIERGAGLEPEHYPENVLYYGKITTRDAVLDDKRRFNARWPQRHYVMDNATIGCETSGDGTTCNVTTQGRWWVSNGQRSGSGTVTGSYRIFWSLNRYPRILIETSVAARDPTLAPPTAQAAPTATPEWITSFFKQFLQ